MTALVLSRADRVLVLAPHPDDETLACGALIQRALALGASVSVVVATNGDDNPWPQRLVERRWRLDHGAATRWGARRALEARDALRILGVCKDDVHFLDWRDQGVTALIEQEPATAIHPLRGMLDSLRPTLVVAPSLSDSHPDHSALALILHAALRGEARPTRVLAYWLHGTRPGNEGSVHVDLTRAELKCKRQAILAHRTQLHFGHGRMLEYARTRETFHEEALPPATRDDWRWKFRVGNRFASAFLHRLRVVGVTADGVMRATTIGLRESGATLRRAGPMLEVAMPPLWNEAASVIAKLDHRHRVYVYDTCAWQTGGHVVQPRAAAFAAVQAPIEFADAGKDRERLPVHPSHLASLPEPDMRPWKILCDFDGTVCLPDATDEVLAHCADPGWTTVERQWRDGSIGSRECMSKQVALIDATEEQLDAVIDGIQIDPGFPRFVAQARALGIELAIVSDGLDYAIHRILRRYGLDDLPLVANRLERISERDWRLSSPHADAGCSAKSGTCKCAWAARARGTTDSARILLIGDGQSDICVAAHVDFVFAMSKLLAHCRSTGIHHRSIGGFEDAIALLPDLIAGRLDTDGASATPRHLEFA